MSRNDQRLSGLYSLAYLGTDAVQPTNITIKNRNPSVSDRRNVFIGSWWLNTNTSDLFYLASLANNLANWINISSSAGATQTLTGNSGGAVSPTANNINVLGDVTTMHTTGTSHTITVSAGGSNLVSTITGNTGGAVGGTGNNINLVGVAPVTVTGNPGTSTQTVDYTNPSPDSFLTQSGTAIPASNILKMFGFNNITTSGAANTVYITADSAIAQSFITSPATGTAVPNAGVLTFESGTANTISAAGSTITINGNTGGGSVPSYSTGTFTPGLAFTGSTVSISISSAQGNYTQIGAAVFITLTLGFTSNGTGLLTVTNLPFTVNSSMADYVISASTFINVYSNLSIAPPRYLWVRFLAGTTTAAFYQEFTNEAATPLLLTPMGGISVTISGWYYM